MENVLDLKMPCVQELGRQELKGVKGGSLFIGLVIGLIIGELNDRNSYNDLIEGWEDGSNFWNTGV